MQHCDAPTLFQLMRTTREVRIKAAKLFFSDPSVWYHLRADGLLQRPSAGESLYKPCFLASVEQLEIYSPHLNLGNWRPDLEGKDFSLLSDALSMLMSTSKQTFRLSGARYDGCVLKSNVSCSRKTERRFLTRT